MPHPPTDLPPSIPAHPYHQHARVHVRSAPTFAHESLPLSHALAKKPHRKRPLCRYFARGHCRVPAHLCRFSHDPVELVVSFENLKMTESPAMDPIATSETANYQVEEAIEDKVIVPAAPSPEAFQIETFLQGTPPHLVQLADTRWQLTETLPDDFPFPLSEYTLTFDVHETDSGHSVRLTFDADAVPVAYRRQIGTQASKHLRECGSLAHTCGWLHEQLATLLAQPIDLVFRAPAARPTASQLPPRAKALSELERRFRSSAFTPRSDTTFTFTLLPTDPDIHAPPVVPLVLHLPLNYPHTACRLQIEPSCALAPALIKRLQADLDLQVSLSPLELTKHLDRQFLRFFQSYTDQHAEEKRAPTGNVFGQETASHEDEMASSPPNLPTTSHLQAVDPAPSEVEGDATFLFPSASKSGTELHLVELRLDGIAVLQCTALALQVQCAHCKTPAVLKGGIGKATGVCGKCRAELHSAFDPALITGAEPRTVLGALTLVNINIVGLLSAHFSVTCAECAENSPGLFRQVQSGRLASAKCRHCHRALTVAFSGTHVHRPMTLLTSARRAVPATSTSVVAPAVSPGHPLPQRGACTHYPRSFRWFRFACCGQVFPCDTCHGGAHPCELGTSMLCGHCAREQPVRYVCGFCHCPVVAKASATGFWEGGKGTRDRTAMRRTDSRKHRNVAKTQSMKHERVGDAKKKKKLKEKKPNEQW